MRYMYKVINKYLLKSLVIILFEPCSIKNSYILCYNKNLINIAISAISNFDICIIRFFHCIFYSLIPCVVQIISARDSHLADFHFLNSLQILSMRLG